MVSAAILSCVLLVGQPQSDLGLELHIQVLTPSVRRGREVLLRVMVRNPPQAKRIWYLLPGFWPIPYTLPGDADLALHVEVRDTAGNLLPTTKAVLLAEKVKTRPPALSALRPGQFIGEDVILTSEVFGFTFPSAGRYIISATVASEAQRWFDRWLREGHQANEVAFDRDSLFVGPIGSGPVTVDISE
jgi:hypothetical protein